MQNSVSESSQLPKIEAHLKQASALEMVRRSFLGAPVFAVISLVMLVRAPLFMDYGFWTVLGGVFLVMLAARGSGLRLDLSSAISVSVKRPLSSLIS